MHHERSVVGEAYVETYSSIETRYKLVDVQNFQKLGLGKSGGQGSEESSRGDFRRRNRN